MTALYFSALRPEDRALLVVLDRGSTNGTSLVRRGAITHLASNGSAGVHDYEMARWGGTSEDVEAGLKDGSFGMAEETGAEMNAAIAAAEGTGLQKREDQRGHLGDTVETTVSGRVQDVVATDRRQTLGIGVSGHGITIIEDQRRSGRRAIS